MMGVWRALGALLLLVLSGASYSYPVKRGSDPDITSSSGNIKSPTADSYWEMPSAVFVPVSSDSLVAPNSDHPESSAKRGSAGGSYSSDAYPVSAYSGYSSGSHADSTQPSFQLGLNQDFSWDVMPPIPQSDKTPPPIIPRFASVKPGLLSYSYVGAPAPLPPVFQKGEMSRLERAFEHGNSESETETQGFEPYPDAEGFYEDFSDPLLDLDEFWSPYPSLDYMFLTGLYPPGTITRYSTSFEQGSEQTHDTHYIKDYAASPDPDDLTQPSQSAQQ